jgi:O-antigen ligase
MNELVPVSEMYGCFWLATHIKYSHRDVQRLVLLVLILVAARGLWQLGYFVLGKADLLIPPIKVAEEWSAEDVSGYSFTRLIDPVSGIHVAVAFALYWSAARGALRFVTLMTMGIGTAVLILGMIRAEWIGTVVCIALVIVRGKRLGSRTLRHLLPALGILLICWTGLALFFQRVSLDLGDILVGRLFTYTQEQLFAPRDSLQVLRFLEVATVTDAFKSAPLFGHGLGNELGTVVSNGGSYEFVVVHNYYLNMLGNAGLTGILLLAYLACRVLQTTRKLLTVAEYPMQRAYILMATVGLIWYGILLGFQPIFSAYHIPSLLGIYLGIGVSSIQGADSDPGEQRVPG